MAKWNDKTGLAKTITVVTTVLMVTLGLCGMNFVGFSLLPDYMSRGAFGQALGSILPALGILEALVIVVCVLLLAVLGIASLVAGRKPPPPPDAGGR